MLADEILATILERPGITAPEIRAVFPDTNRNSVGGAISHLREEGLIVSTGRGAYRAAEAEPPEPATPRAPRRQSSIEPVPLARLMAGR
jgi:hypothetical protein